MKSYCTQNNGDCSTCSLVNYNRDCYNSPIHGGLREGAGRPLADEPKRNHSIKFTDSEWDLIKLKAINDKSISDYIRRKALE